MFDSVVIYGIKVEEIQSRVWVWVWVVLAVYELSPHLEIVYWAPPVRFGTMT